jgi:hypothetical protein
MNMAVTPHEHTATVQRAWCREKRVITPVLTLVLLTMLGLVLPSEEREVSEIAAISIDDEPGQLLISVGDEPAPSGRVEPAEGSADLVHQGVWESVQDRLHHTVFSRWGLIEQRGLDRSTRGQAD